MRKDPVLELIALRHLLFWRGMLALATALVAVRWPQETLIFALVAAGAVFGVMGLFDVVLALRMRRGYSAWWVALVHGLACTAFGVVTLVVPGVALAIAVGIASAWLVVYGAVALIVAWRMRRNQLRWRSVAAWGALNLAFAVSVLAYPRLTITVLLYAGAAYAALLGLVQVGASMRLRRLSLALRAT